MCFPVRAIPQCRSAITWRLNLEMTPEPSPYLAWVWIRLRWRRARSWLYQFPQFHALHALREIGVKHKNSKRRIPSNVPYGVAFPSFPLTSLSITHIAARAATTAPTPINPLSHLLGQGLMILDSSSHHNVSSTESLISFDRNAHKWKPKWRHRSGW